MTSFDAIVRAEVRRRGRVTFAEFMTWALSRPRHGYYMTKGRTGRTGDFVTNVQSGPLFWETFGGELYGNVGRVGVGEIYFGGTGGVRWGVGGIGAPSVGRKGEGTVGESSPGGGEPGGFACRSAAVVPVWAC